MPKSKEAYFRDEQILLAIKKLNTCSIFDLYNYCIINYPAFPWNYHNIRNSITRLLKKDKIKVTCIKQDNIYPRNNHIYIRNKHTKAVIYNSNYNDINNNMDGGLFGFKI